MLKTRVLPMSMILLAAMSYGAVTPLVKVAVQSHIPVGWITVMQYPLPVAAFLLLSLKVLPRRGPKMLAQPGLVAAIALAAALTSVTYYRSIALLPPGFAIVLLFQFAWMVPGLEWALYHKRPTRVHLFTIVGILAGTFLAVPLTPGPYHLYGILYGLAAGLGYSLTLLWSSRFQTGGSLWPRALATTLLSGIIVVLAYHPWDMSVMPQSAWIWGSAIGIFSQLMPIWILYRHAPSLGGNLTAILASAELPVAVALSHLLVSEPITWHQWVGISLMLCSISAGSLSEPSTQVH
ncbi:MAG: DMT family transporter [Firmicutes bacterium]|nr:DMT family transporter [Bacillota bacterium]